MHFDIDLRSLSGHSHDFDVNTLTKDFTLDTKKDTIDEWKERILKRQIVVLQTKRRINNKYYPYVVEFSCFPDFVEPLTCEKIISSAKTNHDCLEGKELFYQIFFLRFDKKIPRINSRDLKFPMIGEARLLGYCHR